MLEWLNVVNNGHLVTWCRWTCFNCFNENWKLEWLLDRFQSSRQVIFRVLMLNYAGCWYWDRWIFRKNFYYFRQTYYSEDFICCSDTSPDTVIRPNIVDNAQCVLVFTHEINNVVLLYFYLFKCFLRRSFVEILEFVQEHIDWMFCVEWNGFMGQCEIDWSVAKRELSDKDSVREYLMEFLLIKVIAYVVDFRSNLIRSIAFFLLRNEWNGRCYLCKWRYMVVDKTKIIASGFMWTASRGSACRTWKKDKV